MTVDPVLSHIQVRPLLEQAGDTPAETLLSLDLGLSQTPVDLLPDGILLPDGRRLAWSALRTVVENENSCYRFDDDGEPRRLAFFSEVTDRAYSLFPTQSAPTMLVSGITMHRIVDCDPWTDTSNKIQALGRPPAGRVLDTCMGLGYTAIQAAATAASVLTCELDPVVESVCRANPWSRRLFENSHIERWIGHVWDILETLEAESFSTIIHDPPMFNMAGELYSRDFYQELYRVLGYRGRLFHYIGNPESRSGATVTRGVVRRRGDAGFKRVSFQPRAFGVLAIK